MILLGFLKIKGIFFVKNKWLLKEFTMRKNVSKFFRCMNATDRLLIDQVYFDQVLKVRKCAEINQK